MNYADYDYYKIKKKGVLTKTEFDTLIIKVNDIIDYNINTELDEQSFKKLKERSQEKLKNTACDLVDLLHTRLSLNSKKVSSISVDGVNKTLIRMTDEEFENEKKEILKFLPDELTCYL